MENYKKRGLNFQHGVDLRVLRRSVQQKASRDRVLNLRRQVLSPLMENCADIPAADVQEQPVSRREALKKYKERKELERKLAAQKMAAKPVFKVQQFKPVVPSYLVSNRKPQINTKSQLKTNIPAKSESVTPVVQKPFTRSMAKQLVDGPSQVKIQRDQHLKLADSGIAAKLRPTRQANAATSAVRGITTQVLPKGGPVRTRNVAAIAAAKVPEPVVTIAVAATKELKPVPTAAAEATFKEPVPVELASATTDAFNDGGAMTKAATPVRRSTRLSFAPNNFQFVPPIGVASVPYSPAITSEAVSELAASAGRSLRVSLVPLPVLPLNDDLETGLPTAPPVLSIPHQQSESMKNFVSLTAVSNIRPSNEHHQGDPVKVQSPLLRRSIKIHTPQLSISGAAEPAVLISEARPKVAQNRRATADLGPTHFRNLLLKETRELEDLCSTWEMIKETDESLIGEEQCKSILATIGMSRLLISQRFHQFSELIDDCEFERGEKPTTCVDLQGFWDMIHYQVEDVTTKFAKLASMKAKNWTGIENTPKRIITRKVLAPSRPMTKPITSKNSDRANAAKLRLAEAKAKAAALKAQAAETAEMPIFWPKPVVEFADVLSVHPSESPRVSSTSSGQQPPMPAVEQEDLDDSDLDPKYFEPMQPPSRSCRRKSRRSFSVSDIDDSKAEKSKYRPSVSPATSLRLLDVTYSARRLSLRRSVLENSLLQSHSVFSPMKATSSLKSQSSSNLMKFSLSPAQNVSSAFTGKENSSLSNTFGLFSP